MEIETAKDFLLTKRKCSFMSISGPNKLPINAMQNLSFPQQEWLWGCGLDSWADSGAEVEEVWAQAEQKHPEFCCTCTRFEMLVAPPVGESIGC